MKSSDSRFNQCLYFSANSFARKVEKLATESWKKIDMAPSHAYVLTMVLEEPGVQPGAIAKEMQLTPSTITRLIEKLEEKKLVVRVTKGKITKAYPTSKAKEQQHKMKACLNDFSGKYRTALGAGESSRMIRHMNRLGDKLP